METYPHCVSLIARIPSTYRYVWKSRMRRLRKKERCSTVVSENPFTGTSSAYLDDYFCPDQVRSAPHAHSMTSVVVF